MIRQAGNLDDGVVRILDRTQGEFKHVGMGILVSPRHIITCAHVVKDAVDGVESDKTGEVITVTFPLHSPEDVQSASVIKYFPAKGRTGDVALLELDRDAAPEIGVARLAAYTDQRLIGNDLRVFASMSQEDPGIHVPAKFVAEAGRGWVQLSVSMNDAGRIEPGFSGGAVWDQITLSVVGMIVARARASSTEDNLRDGKQAYKIPTASLIEQLPEIPRELRRVTDALQFSFIMMALISFVLMLIHLLPSQSSGSPQIIPWAKNDRILASFFGLNIYAVLGPFVAYYAWLYAQGKQLHGWYQRIPPFHTKIAAGGYNTRIGASSVLIFLLLFPAWTQGHFLRRIFNAPRDIFVDYKRFGLMPGPGTICEQGTHFCQHPMVDYWRALPGSLFDHRYQIKGEGDAMVDFFPIVQPFLILSSSFISFGFLIAFLWLVFRRVKP